MAGSITFDDYTVSVVQGAMDDALADEIMAFWFANGALGDRQEARRRVAEVVCVARNRAGGIVGINSVYLSTLGQPPRAYYLYRAFIRKPDRVLGLARSMAYLCFDHLRARTTLPAIRGLALVIENAKLMRLPVKASLERSGVRLAGRDRLGRDVWISEFGDPGMVRRVAEALEGAARESPSAP